MAGQRVQIIKPDPHHTGVLEFGTELVGSADNSIVALLGASPGASTAAYIAIEVLEKCFANELADGWRDRMKTIIPTYGIDLKQDAVACRDIRAQTRRRTQAGECLSVGDGTYLRTLRRRESQRTCDAS